MKPSGVRCVAGFRVGVEQLAHAVGAPHRGRFEHAEASWICREQHVGRCALLVEQREQDHGEAARVAGRGERRVLADQLAHGVDVAARDGCDQRVGHSRTIPHTRSDTSLVNAASSSKNACGLPFDVSLELDVAGLELHVVAEVRARSGRQLEPEARPTRRARA